MATTVARLQAILEANTRDFDRAMGRSETKMGKLSKAAGLTGAAIAGGIALGAVKAIKDASNLNEQINKTNVVFGRSGKEVNKWAKGLAKNFGLSTRAALESAGTFGNMLVPMGFAKTKAAELSKKMVELAGDMASFNNASPEEVLEALRSGLAGEVEPLRKFGIFLSQDRVQAEALSSGIVKANVSLADLHVRQVAVKQSQQDLAEAQKKYGKGSLEVAAAQAHLEYAEQQVHKVLAGKVPQLTAAQKAQATYNIITKDTTAAQGDFSRTSGSLANQQRILNAQLENVSAQIGTKLLPATVKLLNALNNVIGAFQKIDHFMGKFGGDKTFADFFVALGHAVPTKPLHQMADALEAVWGWLNKIIDAFKWLIDNAKKIGSVFSGIAGVAGKLPGIGDVDPNRFKSFLGGFGTGPKSINPRLYDELSGARAFGLTLTSGYRPGAVTRHGTPSDHGVFPSKAIDVAGPPNRMAAFFRWLIGQTDVKQAFYDPLGSIFGGMLSSYREGGHSDHVHVATYDQGGFLRPGWNLAYNGLGRPEPVGWTAPGQIDLHIDGNRLFTWFLNEKQKRDRRGDRF